MTVSSWRRIAAAAGVAVAGHWALAAAAMGQDVLILGVWATPDKSEVTIEPCPQGFCGRLSKIVLPPDIVAQYGDQIAEIGNNILDYRNENPALRGRPIQDLPILELRAGRNPYVFDGQVYNPQDGKTYSGYVQVLEPNRLRLNGCVLFNVICQGQDWTRVEQPLEDAPIPAEASLRPRT